MGPRFRGLSLLATALSAEPGTLVTISRQTTAIPTFTLISERDGFATLHLIPAITWSVFAMFPRTPPVWWVSQRILLPGSFIALMYSTGSEKFLMAVIIRRMPSR